MTDDPPFLAWLKDPATHGLARGADVQVLETPACWVVLAGERALKVKKPVDLGFLDFSTLEKRRSTMCEELRLNRRTAPDYYLKLADITQDGAGRFAFDGEGETVDVALVMKRFAQERLLSRVAEAEGISDEIAEALGDSIAAFHRSEPPAPGAQDEAGLRSIHHHAEINAAALKELARAFGSGDAERAIAATAAAIAQHAPLIEARGEAGWVRHLHGDLHLENIFLDDAGRPTPFDALEFDRELATTDVMLDLAFPLMDLVHRGQARAANRTLNVWLDRTARAEEGALGLACADGLALLPLCLSMRATVRAHVRARLALSVEGPEHRRRCGEAQSYLDHALAWLDPPPALLIAIGGRSGTGKSTLAKSLAPKIGGAAGAVIVRSDEVRKRLFGAAPDEPLPKSAYAPDSHERVYTACFTLARRALAAGASVILDAAFLDPAERDAARAVALDGDVPFTGLWLEAPPEILIARVSERKGDASDADVDVVRAQLERDVGAVDWRPLDASRPSDSVLRDALVAEKPR